MEGGGVGERRHTSHTPNTHTLRKERSLVVAWEGEGSLELNIRLKFLGGQNLRFFVNIKIIP